jgi:mRNA interferase YafQ
MYRIFRTKGFERSYRLLKKSGHFKQKLKSEVEGLINLLANGDRLPVAYRDHELKGDLRMYRECHVRGDLVIVYQKTNVDLVLVLVDIGSHSYIFG